jgi:hypothetical protein
LIPDLRLLLITGVESLPEVTEEEVMKKLSEMSTLLEAREGKLIELSRTNVELQEANAELQRWVHHNKVAF